jgi:hypothetical protein
MRSWFSDKLSGKPGVKDEDTVPVSLFYRPARTQQMRVSRVLHSSALNDSWLREGIKGTSDR